MARKKFAKAAGKSKAPAAPKAPVNSAQPSQLQVTLGADVLTIQLPTDNGWAGIDKVLKPWLAGKSSPEMVVQYTSGALRGQITQALCRSSGLPYTPEDILKAVREFAYKELLELYAEKAPKGSVKVKKSDSDPAPDA